MRRIARAIPRDEAVTRSDGLPTSEAEADVDGEADRRLIDAVGILLEADRHNPFDEQRRRTPSAARRQTRSAARE